MDWNNEDNRVYEKITDYENKQHEKNKQRIKIGIRLVLIIPMIFLLVMFLEGSNKVVFLVLWIASLFSISAYLISIEYMDYKMQRRMEDWGVRDYRSFDGLIDQQLIIEKVIARTADEKNFDGKDFDKKDSLEKDFKDAKKALEDKKSLEAKDFEEKKKFSNEMKASNEKHYEEKKTLEENAAKPRQTGVFDGMNPNPAGAFAGMNQNPAGAFANVNPYQPGMNQVFTGAGLGGAIPAQMPNGQIVPMILMMSPDGTTQFVPAPMPPMPTNFNGMPGNPYMFPGNGYPANPYAFAPNPYMTGNKNSAATEQAVEKEEPDDTKLDPSTVDILSPADHDDWEMESAEDELARTMLRYIKAKNRKKGTEFDPSEYMKSMEKMMNAGGNKNE